MKIVPTMPEASVLSELGERARQYRIGMNLTQAELATNAGVAQRTIERFEAGNSVQLDKLVRIFRALRLSTNLDQLLPEASIHPIQLAASREKVRRRSHKRRSASQKGEGWTWGDKK